MAEQVQFRAGNQVPYGQDWRHRRGVPDGVVFTIETGGSFQTEGTWKLVADGYGRLDKPNSYGNGALYVRVSDVGADDLVAKGADVTTEQERVTITLTREQAVDLLALTDKSISSCDKWLAMSDKPAPRLTSERALHIAIAEQLREKGVGEKGGMLSHPLSCRCEECEPDYA